MSKPRLSKINFEEAKALYLEGHSCVDIAPVFGVTPSGINSCLRRQGFQLRPVGNRTGLYKEDRDNEIEKLYKGGMKVKEISALLGVSSSTIAEVKKARSLEHRGKPFSLTESQIDRLVDEYQNGAVFSELALNYKVSDTTIGDALRRRGVKIRIGWSRYRVTCWQDSKGRKFIFKSTWELKFAVFLETLGVCWDYEPRSFKLSRGFSRYTPDFYIKDADLWVEIHGWYDIPTSSRIRVFCDMYPTLKFLVLGPKEMSELCLIESWYENHKQAEKVTHGFSFAQRTTCQ